MSTIVLLTPVIISSWPLITAAVAGAAAGMGLAVKEIAKEGLENVEETAQSVEIELAESQVSAENVATGKEVVLVKDGVEIRVGRDNRGRCTVCAKGKGKTKAELKMIAEEFTEKMTQCFVYNRVVSELKNKDFQVVNEEVMEDQTVRINVRRWVD